MLGYVVYSLESYIFDREIKILEELNFSWPTDDIKRMGNKQFFIMQAYIQTKKFFYKRDYVHSIPWHDDNNLIPILHQIVKSYPIIELIKEKRTGCKRIILEIYFFQSR